MLSPFLSATTGSTACDRLGPCFPYERSEQALSAHGVASVRRRRLPAHVVWRVTALELFRRQATRQVRAMQFGAYDRNEMRYAHGLLAHIEDHTLTVFDKEFMSALLPRGLSQSGGERHCLRLAKSSTRMEILSGTPEDCRVRLRISV